MILTCSNLDYDSLRKIVLIVLKDGKISQYGDIKARVMNHLLDNKIIKETSSFSLSSGYSNQLSGQDSEMVLQIVWDLIIERVLTIGYNHLNENWPFLRLTDYGKEIIKQSDNVIVEPKLYVETPDQIIDTPSNYHYNKARYIKNEELLYKCKDLILELDGKIHPLAELLRSEYYEN